MDSHFHSILDSFCDIQHCVLEDDLPSLSPSPAPSPISLAAGSLTDSIHNLAPAFSYLTGLTPARGAAFANGEIFSRTGNQEQRRDTRSIVGVNGRLIPTTSSDFKRAGLIIIGQGTVSFQIEQPPPTVANYSINFLNKEGNSVGSAIINNNQVDITLADFKAAGRTQENLIKFAESTKFLWVSLDKENRCAKIGHGYMMASNTICTNQLPPPPKEGADIPAFAALSSIHKIEIQGSDIKVGESPKMIVFPILRDAPPVIKESNKITLADISHNRAITPAMLPTAGQYLYSVVAGNEITISWYDAQAISYSFKTKGKLLCTMAEKKSSEFHDSSMVYIRVTIGPNLGNSPGSPYIMELWPPGNMSPIHNHSWAVGVIKVLHGTIHCRYFNPLAKNNPGTPKPILEKDFFTNEVTFLTPEIYQTHQLHNLSTDNVCVTSQSYRYLDNDVTHYEFFDYIDKTKPEKLWTFKPKSDIEYLQLLKQVRKEYSEIITIPSDIQPPMSDLPDTDFVYERKHSK